MGVSYERGTPVLNSNSVHKTQPESDSGTERCMVHPVGTGSAIECRPCRLAGCEDGAIGNLSVQLFIPPARDPLWRWTNPRNSPYVSTPKNESAPKNPRRMPSPRARQARPRSPSSYRGTSLIRKRHPIGPYSRPVPRALWWS